MENKPDSFTSTDGKKMFYQCWIPSGKPELIIALVHGLGEHSGRYEHLAEMFCRRSIALAAFDLRGHGLSEGKRGHFSSMKLVFDDIGFFLKKTTLLFPDIPVVLYGHSLGGNLAVNYVLNRRPELSALIMTSPWLRLAITFSKTARLVLSLASHIIPFFTKSSGLDVNNLSHDAKVIEEYRNDPLVHDRISVNLFISAYYGGEKAIVRAGEISLPVLIMHGTEDRITSPDGTRIFNENSGKNVELRFWEGYYHELHNEPGKDAVFSYLTGWLKKMQENN